MEHLLYLVHRIPYPPNKGDKIRSYHLLKHLTQRYHVHLGTFIDDPDDWQHVDTVKQFCASTHFANLDSRTARVRSLPALFSDRPLTLDYYGNRDMQAWVTKTIRLHSIKRVVVFSSAMAQYVADLEQVRRVIDFVDIDSDKWRQYANKKSWPMSWIYRREGRQLLRYERRIAEKFDASLFVSTTEADMFKQLAPESADKIDALVNGVDTEYYAPEHDYANPYSVNQSVIVFTGAMDYWPNVDAVQWYAKEIFPAVLAKHPDAHFYIVGARPNAQVQALAALSGVHVTGSVPDIRPYIAHARLAVAPLRIARGIQSKVLEAMSMAKPVIVSPQALEGINGEPDRELLLADGVEQYIATTSARLMQNKAEENRIMGNAARIKVIKEYSWISNLPHIDKWLDPSTHSNNTSINIPSKALS